MPCRRVLHAHRLPQTYDGERSATGERHGQGTATFPGGDVYLGAYYNGRRHGHGTYSWKKPRARYVGEYVDSWRHGRGMMCHPDGGRYQGEYVAGKRHGYGVYVYPNGDVYAGEWVHNKKHGQGVYSHTSGTKAGIVCIVCVACIAHSVLTLHCAML